MIVERKLAEILIQKFNHCGDLKYYEKFDQVVKHAKSKRNCCKHRMEKKHTNDHRNN